MTIRRRDFLGWAGATGVLTGATGLLSVPQPLDASEKAGFPLQPIQAADWDVSWVERVRSARYRAVFDSPDISDGLGLLRAFFWWDQYKEVFGISRAEMVPVVVLRHTGISLIMDDEYWSRFGADIDSKSMFTGETLTANPLLHTPPGVPPQFAEYTLDNFFASGGIALACNLAFQEVIGRYAGADNLQGPAAAAAAKEHVLPRMTLQPSGVFAVLHAGEHGCRYLYAS